MSIQEEDICSKFYTEQRLILLDSIQGYEKAKPLVDKNLNLLQNLCSNDLNIDQYLDIKDPRLFDLNTQDCLCHLQGLWLRIFYKQKDNLNSRAYYIYKLLLILIIDQEDQKVSNHSSLYQQSGLRIPQKPKMNNLQNLISLLKLTSFKGIKEINSETFQDVAKIVFNFVNNMANYLIIEDLLKIYQQAQCPKQLNIAMDLDKQFDNEANWFRNQSNLGVWAIPFYESYELALVVIECLKLPIRFIYHKGQHNIVTDTNQETKEIETQQKWKKNTFFLEDYQIKEQTTFLIVELYEKRSGQPLNESNYQFDNFYNDVLEISINHQQHKNQDQVPSYDPENHCFRGTNSQEIIKRINLRDNQTTLGLINLFEVDTSQYDRVPLNLFHIYFVANEEAFDKIFSEIPTEVPLIQVSELRG